MSRYCSRRTIDFVSPQKVSNNSLAKSEDSFCNTNSNQEIAVLHRCRNIVHDTANKYNGSSFDINPFIVGLDWLTLNLRGNLLVKETTEELQDGNFTYINLGHGTEKFKSVFKLYYEYREFGTIQVYPRAAIFHEDTIFLQVQNECFYNGTNIWLILQELFDIHGLEFKNITRCDVFLDNYGFLNGVTLDELDYLLNSGQILSNTRVKSKSKHDGKVDGKFINTGFHWGERKNHRFLKIYNKTEELKVSGKDYISEYHKINGLTKEPIQRFEYTLKNDFFKYNPSFELKDLFDKKALFEILDLARKGHFSFVIEDGQKRNDRKKEFKLIDWEGMREYPDFIYDYKYVKPRKEGVTNRAKQNLIKGLFGQYILQGQEVSFLEKALFLVYDSRLNDWFQKMVDRYIKEYLRKRTWLYKWDHDKLNSQIVLITDKYKREKFIYI